MQYLLYLYEKFFFFFFIGVSAVFYLRGPNKRAGGIEIVDGVKITGGIKIINGAITAGGAIVIKKTKEIIINSLIFG